MGLFGPSTPPLQDIAELKQRGDHGSIVRKYFMSKDRDVQKAAIEAVWELKGSLTFSDRGALASAHTKLLKGGDTYLANQIAWMINAVENGAFAKVAVGMSTSDVVRTVGPPSQKMTGAEYVAAYRVGVIGTGQSLAKAATQQHWIYRSEASDGQYWLLVFDDGRVSETHSMSTKADF
jgi:hypothetical protein